MPSLRKEADDSESSNTHSCISSNCVTDFK